MNFCGEVIAKRKGKFFILPLFLTGNKRTWSGTVGLALAALHAWGDGVVKIAI